MRGASWTLSMLALVTWSGVALAQQSPAAAAASAQFDRGLADMQAGNFATGCPALRESYRLDPKPGALFTAAECEAAWGKLASALGGYGDFLALVGRMTEAQRLAQERRVTIATAQREKLAATVPKLTISLPPQAGAGVTVELDGTLLGGPSLGVALPVDPGDHVVVTRTRDGQREQKIAISVSEEKRIEVELPAAKVEAPPPVVVPVRVEPRPAPASSRRPYAIGAFALGVTGIAVGAVAGALTLGDKSTIDDECKGIHCSPQGKAAADRAQVTGLVSTIGFFAGGAGAALGVVLWVTDTRRSSTPPPVGAVLTLGPAPRLAIGASF